MTRGPDESSEALRAGGPEGAQALVYARELRDLYEVTRAQATRFRLLIEMGRELVAAPGVDVLLQIALDRTTAFSGHDGGSVLLASPDGALVVRASLGVDAAIPGTRVDDLARSLAGRALRDRQPLVIQGRGQAVGTAWRTYNKDIPSAICLPLVTSGGEAIGVLALKSTAHVRPIDAEDLEALQLLAGQLAAVLQSAQFRERLQASLDALVALHEAGQVLGASLDVADVGRRLLDLAGRVAGIEAGVITLRTPGGRLRVWQTVGPEAVWRPARRMPTAGVKRRAALASGASQFFRLRRPGDPSARLAGWCLPLRGQDEIAGILEVYGPDERSGEATADILGSLTHQAASALENARLYSALAEREHRLQDLVGRLLVAQEEERRRVAYDVHDELAQVAASTHQHLQAFARHHRPRSPEARTALDQVAELAKRTVEEARRVIANLRPTALDDFGLATALRLQVEALQAEGWQIAYDERLGAERLAPAIEAALYRVAQEALTNVRKHARTTQVQITLERRGQVIRLAIEDQGRGFRPTDGGPGRGPGERVGLSGMQERIALLGGQCRIRSRPGAGTRVLVEVPVQTPEELPERTDGP